MQITKSKSAYAVSAGYPCFSIYIYCHVSLPWGVFLAFHPLFLLPPTLLVSHRGRSSQYDLSKRQNFSFWGLKLDFRNGRGGLFLGISRFPRKKSLPRNLRAELPPWIFLFWGVRSLNKKVFEVYSYIQRGTMKIYSILFR